MSQRDIAKKLQVGKSSIGHYIKDVWQIAPPEKTSEINQKLVRNKEEIIRFYVEEKMTTREIAKIYEVSDTTIATYLKNFKVKLRPPQNQMQPLDKKIYGYLEPIEPIHENGFAKWRCKCHLCGQGHKNVITNDLTSGKIIHCGCASMSNGALKIRLLLQEAQIPFKMEYWFDDFRYEKSNLPIRFDFYVNNEYLIEFDGE